MKAIAVFFFFASFAYAAQLTPQWTYSSKDVPVPTSFVIERGTGKVAQTFNVVATVPGTARSYLDTGLISKTKYSYRIRAVLVKPDGTEIYGQYSNVATKPAR